MVFWVGKHEGDSLFAPNTFAILIYWFENAFRPNVVQKKLKNIMKKL